MGSGMPNLVFNTSVGSYQQMQFLIRDRLLNNATDFCKLSNFTISKVVDLGTGSEVDSKRSMQFVAMTEDGLLHFKQFSVLKNVAIFIKVFNGVKNITVDDPVLGHAVYQPPINPPNSAPFLNGSIGFTEIDLQGDLKNKEFRIQIPEILDSNPKSVFKLQLNPTRDFLSLDVAKRQIIVALDKIKTADIQMNFVQLIIEDE